MVQAFVSHSSQDSSFAGQLVSALRAVDIDVWWDEKNLGSGLILDNLMREVHTRTIFILILSRNAVTSEWVRRECLWAFQLLDEQPYRVLLPVTASRVDLAEFRPQWMFLEALKRIELPGGEPYAPEEAISQTLRFLVPDADDEGPGCMVPPGLTAEELTRLGMSLYFRFKHECAIRYCRRATELDPTYVSAWYNLAYALSEVGRQDEALVACDRVLTLHPRHSFAWNLRGYILCSIGRYQEQLEATERALELKPNLPRNWANKAEALLCLRRYDTALAACEQGIALNPKDKFAREAKAHTLMEIGRYEEALGIYDSLLAEKHRRQAPAYYKGKGEALQQLGRYQEALVAFHQTTLLDPANPDAWRCLAQTLRALGLHSEAHEATRKATEAERRL